MSLVEKQDGKCRAIIMARKKNLCPKNLYSSCTERSFIPKLINFLLKWKKFQVPLLVISLLYPYPSYTLSL